MVGSAGSHRCGKARAMRIGGEGGRKLEHKGTMGVKFRSRVGKGESGLMRRKFARNQNYSLVQLG